MHHIGVLLTACKLRVFRASGAGLLRPAEALWDVSV